MNPYNDKDGSSSSSGLTDEEAALIYGQRRRTTTNMLLQSSILCMQQYHMSYVDKVPRRTSALTGYDWVMELLTGHDSRC